MHNLAAALAATITAVFSIPAMAADMPVRMPVKAPVVMPGPAYNWSGFYVGIHGGYAWGELTSANDATIDHEPSGALLGGQVGWNWQFNNIVLGVEADLAWSGVDGADTTTFGAFQINGSHKMKYLATARGRIGLAHDRMLFYVTGGYAWSKVDGAINVVGVVSGTDSISLGGWTVGGGIEWAFAQNLTARLEYLYIDFDSETTRMNLGFPFQDQVDKNLNVIRLGLNLKL